MGDLPTSVEFADGTIWTDTDIQGRLTNTIPEETIIGTTIGETIDGSDLAEDISALAGDDVVNAMGGDDVIDGGSGNDTIDGGAGNDIIDGSFDNDTITGGTGNDRLINSSTSGRDTYIYNLGDGHDIIEDGSTGNNIVLGAGITPAMVALKTDDDGRGLILTFAGVEGSIRVINNYMFGSPTVIGDNSGNGIQFDDGTVWGRTQINSMIGLSPTVTGTDGSDLVYRSLVSGLIDPDPEPTSFWKTVQWGREAVQRHPSALCFWFR